MRFYELKNNFLKVVRAGKKWSELGKSGPSWEKWGKMGVKRLIQNPHYPTTYIQMLLRIEKSGE